MNNYVELNDSAYSNYPSDNEYHVVKAVNNKGELYLTLAYFDCEDWIALDRTGAKHFVDVIAYDAQCWKL